MSLPTDIQDFLIEKIGEKHIVNDIVDMKNQMEIFEEKNNFYKKYSKKCIVENREMCEMEKECRTKKTSIFNITLNINPEKHNMHSILFFILMKEHLKNNKEIFDLDIIRTYNNPNDICNWIKDKVYNFDETEKKYLHGIQEIVLDEWEQRMIGGLIDRFDDIAGEVFGGCYGKQSIKDEYENILEEGIFEYEFDEDCY